MSAALGGWAAAASIAVAAVYWAISFSRYEVGGAANASGSANANANGLQYTDDSLIYCARLQFFSPFFFSKRSKFRLSHQLF